MAFSPQSAFSGVINDIIKGKKVSKWVIQLLLILGITLICKQIFYLIYLGTDKYLMMYPFYIIIKPYASIITHLILLIIFFRLSINYKNWLTNIINEASSHYLEYQDIDELMNIFEGVLNNEKSIVDYIDLNEKTRKLIILGISNTLLIVILLMFIDLIITKFIDESIFIQAGSITGILFVTASLLIYLYFEIEPLQEVTERQDTSSSNMLPLFFKKLYDNVATTKKESHKNIASIITLFFIIPKMNIRKQRYWIGAYMCTPELREFILDVKNRENIEVDFPYRNYDEFFKCDDIHGLEDLLDTKYILPLDLIKKYQGSVGSDHPKEMKGLTIKFKKPNNGKKLTYVSMIIVPWKGRRFIRELEKENKKIDNIINNSYKVITTIENHRVFTIYIMGESDTVESLRYQLSLKAPEASTENINFGSLH